MLNYKVIGQTVPVVEILLQKGQKVYTQRGGMAYQSAGINMSTNARNGIMSGIGRMFAGESMFMANYEALQDNAMVAFASTVPGTIVPIDMTQYPQGLILQKGAFLCAEDTINTKVELTKRFSAGLFGGEGFILQRATGTGNLFLEVDGDIIEKVLQPGEVIKVDTGNIVSFEPTMQYEIETVKGLGNILFGGEGLFLTKLTGPGRVMIQSQNFGEFANRLIPYMPKGN